MRDKERQTTIKLKFFVQERLLEVQAKEKLKRAKMARIAGYERVSFGRVLDGKTICRQSALYQLSLEYCIPMGFWYPSVTSEVVRLPAVRVRKATPQEQLVEHIIQQLSLRSLHTRKKLLKLLEGDDDLFELVLLLNDQFGHLEKPKRKKLFALLQAYAEKQSQAGP